MKVKTQTGKNAVAGAFVASFAHTCNRFIAGKSAGNKLETAMFEKFKHLSPKSKELMQKTTKSFNALSAKKKSAAAIDLINNPNKPVDANSLGKAFAQELTSIVSGLALENTEAPLKERPGKVRLYKYGGDDVYPTQIHIFKINNLRTNDHVPFLEKGDYLPEEFQTVCTPKNEAGKIKWDCKAKKSPCDGYSIDNVCLRVQQIQSGTSVTLTGVNFFDINSEVWMKRKGSTGSYKKLDAFVYGDITTPASKIVHGKAQIIADNRVNDKIFFSIPADTAAGIYEFKVAVPNSSGFSGPGFSDTLFTSTQYLEVVPPSTARFQISSERLWARDETGSFDWTGSDEVGIKVNAIPFFPDLTLGTMQQHGFRFGDVDSEETRTMESILFTHTKPIAGVILSVIGHEVDSEDAYKNQITEWTDIFVELLKEQLEFILANSEEARKIVKKLSEMGFWGYVIMGAAFLITLAIDFIYSVWAPADLIIFDTLAYSVADLGKMTSINYPSPVADSDKTLYRTADDDIQVRLMLSNKVPNEYTEERGYLSNNEDSWYNISFRYNRLT